MNKTEKERLAVIEEQMKQNNIQHSRIEILVTKMDEKLDRVIEEKANKKTVDNQISELTTKIKSINGWKDKTMWGIISFLAGIIGFLLKGGF